LGVTNPATAKTHSANAHVNKINLIKKFLAEYWEVNSFTNEGSPIFLTVFCFHFINAEYKKIIKGTAASAMKYSMYWK
jgi:hypothetical protein